MDVDEVQMQGCKFPRIGNRRSDGNKIGQKGVDQYSVDEEDGEVRRVGENGSGGADIGVVGRFCGWPSSRIVRVSRASGGKDRHSKVLTSRGLRDRRIRLSVTTAIQFYDLQDRLGLDQPSKAVEWLLKAAATSIDELPPMKTSLPETPKQLSDEKRSSAGTEQGFDSNEVELDGDPNYQQQQQNVSFSKSACSSTSETSKCSSLSLSRSESRIKARERARERAAEKEKESESRAASHSNVNPISQSSFSDLLTAGLNSVSNHSSSPNGSAQQNQGGCGEANLFHKNRQWSSGLMDCFTTGFFGSSRNNNHSSGFPGQIHLGSSLPTISQFNVSGDHHPELQHFSPVPDHLVPVTTGSGSGSEYNLNFTISSSLAGFSRGTLQSNSPSLTLPHLHRFSPLEGQNEPFFIGSATPVAAPMENHQQYPASLDHRLHLYYGDSGSRHSDQKGKGKN